MRYAIISDIHGNLEAFKAVLEALKDERIDDYLSLGDVVGYGADPKECIKLLKSVNPKVAIAGNHEWGALGLKNTEDFTDIAGTAVAWTRNILDADELEYLRSFGLVHEDEKMALAHGTLNSPEEFYYIFDTDDAQATISEMRSPLCFIGHTHVPGIFVSEEGKLSVIDASSIRLDNDNKYIVNAGSIGQPRDGDNRSSYVIYDDEEFTLDIKRVEYDVKKAQERILRAGLPARLAARLSEGR